MAHSIYGRPRVEILEDRSTPAPLTAAAAPTLGASTTSLIAPISPTQELAGQPTTAAFGTVQGLPGQGATAQQAAALVAPGSPLALSQSLQTSTSPYLLSVPTAFVSRFAPQALGPVVTAPSNIDQASIGFPGRIVFPGTGVQMRSSSPQGPLSQQPGVFLSGGNGGQQVPAASTNQRAPAEEARPTGTGDDVALTDSADGALATSEAAVLDLVGASTGTVVATSIEVATSPVSPEHAN